MTLQDRKEAWPQLSFHNDKDLGSYRPENAAQERAETAEKRPMEVLDEQVGELLSSSGPAVSASEIACKLNERYFGEYKSISACLVGKTESWKRHREEIESLVED